MPRLGRTVASPTGQVKAIEFLANVKRINNSTIMSRVCHISAYKPKGEKQCKTFKDGSHWKAGQNQSEEIEDKLNLLNLQESKH